MSFDYRKFLINPKSDTESFSSFMNDMVEKPRSFLYTSPSLVADAIRSFGYQIVVKSGEPVINYSIFTDPFSDGINAIYGQEFCVDKILDIVDSADQEAVPRRGIILVGPPSSGKTNIIDMVTRGLEEYTRREDVKVCTFSIVFEQDGKKFVYNSPFMHHPILLIPITSKHEGKIVYPRREFLNELEIMHPDFMIPNYYKNATLDKVTLNMLDYLVNSYGESYSDILEKYIRVERTNFSIAQGRGIANIDDMKKLSASVKAIRIGASFQNILDNFIPGLDVYTYEGSLVSSNRGILHIHDAFSKINDEDKYRPLLMLLGSGKISVEATQTFLDTTVFITTNLEEMKNLEGELTSKKLLDRVEKVPVNYLVDANSEMEILERDIVAIKDKYDIDPNLVRIASYYAIMTRLFPPLRTIEELPKNWSDEKKDLYRSLPTEKKMIIYSSQSRDPIKTIRSLPPLHPFRNECTKLGIDLEDVDSYKDKVYRNDKALTLEESGLFSNEEIKMIDDEFMRLLIREHQVDEGKYGMSVRQLQNIMRDTIASSDGRKITVNQFIRQLTKIVTEGSSVHYWLRDEHIQAMSDNMPMQDRFIGEDAFDGTDGVYGNYSDLIQVVAALYNAIIKKEITIAAVNRDPEKIEKDLRRYVQYVLLHRASKNKSFSKVLVEQYSFIDPIRGTKVDYCDTDFMASIESILLHKKITMKQREDFRDGMADKFYKLKDSGELKIKEGFTVFSSSDDNFKFCFAQEYSALLSHSRLMEDIDINQLEEGFYHKYNSPARYKKCNESIRKLVEMVINNMVRNNGYSEDMALETIIYALTEHVIDFSEILN